MDQNELSVGIRNITYEGGDALIDIFNDIVFSIKYPIAAKKIDERYRNEIIKLCAEIITIVTSDTNEILTMAGIDSIDDL